VGQEARTKKRVIGTHIIAMLRNYPMTAADALAEGIDNVHDAGGTETWIDIYSDHVCITDNGPGVDDLNRLVDISNSLSVADASKLGRFGLGSKLMQLYFGDDILFESVRNGEYRRERYNWREVEQSGDLGNEWSAKNTLPLRKAPRAILGGGLRISIRQLNHSHRYRKYLDDICERLTYRYRPGLANGKRITVIDHTKKPAVVRVLTPSLDALGVYNNMQYVDGEVSGLKFRVGFGDLKEHKKLLSGVHFIYGDRVITKTTALGNQAMPAKLYAEVTLLPDPDGWKACLSPTKTEIVRLYDELCEAVLAILKDWIDLLAKYDEEFYIEEFSSIFSNQFSNVLIFKPRQQGQDPGGDYRPGDEIETTGRGRKRPGPPPPEPHPHERNREAIYDPENGTGDAMPRRKRLSGFRLVCASKELGDHQIADYEYKDNCLIVRVHEKKALIADAMVKPYKVNVMWGVIATQIAKFARDLARSNQLETTGAWLIDMLTKAGFKPNAEEPEQLFDQVNCFVVDKFVGEAKRRNLELAA
jgi:Histidine kinase-, DNA gyrase B-, and HSP90-like ATPase